MRTGPLCPQALFTCSSYLPPQSKNAPAVCMSACQHRRLLITGRDAGFWYVCVTFHETTYTMPVSFVDAAFQTLISSTTVPKNRRVSCPAHIVRFRADHPTSPNSSYGSKSVCTLSLLIRMTSDFCKRLSTLIMFRLSPAHPTSNGISPPRQPPSIVAELRSPSSRSTRSIGITRRRYQSD